MAQPAMDGDGAGTKDDMNAAGVAFVVAIEATGESMAQAAAAATVLVVAFTNEAKNDMMVIAPSPLHSCLLGGHATFDKQQPAEA